MNTFNHVPVLQDFNQERKMTHACKTISDKPEYFSAILFIRYVSGYNYIKIVRAC